MRTNVIRRMGLSVLIGMFTFGMALYASPNEETYAKVNNTGVLLVDAPNSNSSNVRELQKEEILLIGDQVDNYIEVILDYGKVAYIDAQYIEKDLDKDLTEKPEVEEPKVDKGQEVVDFALQFVGNPYVYGGTSLTKGADCSGFTSQVFKNNGVNLQRTSGAQYSSNGTHVKKSDLKAGDLVFFGYKGKVTHVAIYMGNNKIVHAGSERTGIHVSPFEQRGMAPYMGAKRVI